MSRQNGNETITHSENPLRLFFNALPLPVRSTFYKFSFLLGLFLISCSGPIQPEQSANNQTSDDATAALVTPDSNDAIPVPSMTPRPPVNTPVYASTSTLPATTLLPEVSPSSTPLIIEVNGVPIEFDEKTPQHRFASALVEAEVIFDSTRILDVLETTDGQFVGFKIDLGEHSDSYEGSDIVLVPLTVPLAEINAMSAEELTAMLKGEDNNKKAFFFKSTSIDELGLVIGTHYTHVEYSVNSSNGTAAISLIYSDAGNHRTVVARFVLNPPSQDGTIRGNWQLVESTQPTPNPEVQTTPTPELPKIVDSVLTQPENQDAPVYVTSFVLPPHLRGTQVDLNNPSTLEELQSLFPYDEATGMGVDFSKVLTTEEFNQSMLQSGFIPEYGASSNCTVNPGGGMGEQEVVCTWANVLGKVRNEFGLNIIVQFPLVTSDGQVVMVIQDLWIEQTPFFRWIVERDSSGNVVSSTPSILPRDVGNPSSIIFANSQFIGSNGTNNQVPLSYLAALDAQAANGPTGTDLLSLLNNAGDPENAISLNQMSVYVISQAN